MQKITRYQIYPKNWILVKGCGCLFFAKSIGRFIGKNISGKYSQKLFGHAKQSATNTLKAASWEAIEKTAEATGDLFGKKMIKWHMITFKRLHLLKEMIKQLIITTLYLF